jgi:hypothetical protein
MKTPRGDHTAARLADGRVLMAGGSHDSEVGNLAQAELYDPATGRFTATGSVATVRSDATATLLSDGRVLIAGGFHPGFPPSAIDSAELYDPTTGKFSPTGSMATARYGGTATRLSDGCVLIAGGMDDNTTLLASTELYQP